MSSNDRPPRETLRQQARRRQIAAFGLLGAAAFAMTLATREQSAGVVLIAAVIAVAAIGLLLLRQARADLRREHAGALFADFAGISLRESSGPVMAFVGFRPRLARVTGRLAVEGGVLRWSPDRTSRRLGKAHTLALPVEDVSSAEAERVLGKPFARLQLADGSTLLLDLRKAARLVEVLTVGTGGSDLDA